ncbi:MAG: DNA translocase FtsK 4TM domain-containing protein [bacterium]
MGKNKKQSGKQIFSLIIAVGAILFVVISLFSSIVGQNSPKTNFGGVVGYYIAQGLIFLFGAMSPLVPIFLALALLLKFLKKKLWRRFTAFGILAFTVFLGAAILSHYAGIKNAQDNFCGVLGYTLSNFLLPLFGLGSLTFISLGFYWGFTLWFRITKRTDLIRSIFILIYGLILELFLAYFRTERESAGLTGIKVVRFLNSLFGIGTLILLIVVLTAVIIASGLTIPRLKKISNPFHKLFFNLRTALTPKLKQKPLVTVSQPQITCQAPVENSPPPDTEHQTAASPNNQQGLHSAVTTFTLQSSRPRLSHLNLDQFQQQFLQCLDIPTASDKLLKEPAEAENEGQLLMNKLQQFGVDGKLTAILSGPMITRFEMEPAPGVRCSGIESLADDIALALSAERVRILAPIPGKSAVGIEIPNKMRRTVYLREVITSRVFQEVNSPLGFALGTTITGEPYCADIRQMPHVLIAGTTGSGKSVCINSILMSIIYRSTPDEVRFLTIDPKQLELPIYNPIPHLLSRTTTNPELVVSELTRIVNIMEARYSEFAELGVRDISTYNTRCEEMGKKRKPYILVVIDELADLMQRAPAEIETRIIRLAQMSRAVGIHLILATQRPSVDVITGLIKANFPCRIAFQVATKVDSRTILDANGAESLLGRGDMLFLPPGKGDAIRLHGCFVSEKAAKGVVELWATRYLTEILSEFIDEPERKAREIVQQELVDVFYDPRVAARGRKLEQILTIIPREILDTILSRGYYEILDEEVGKMASASNGEDATYGEYDPLFPEAARLVLLNREASVSMLQRRLDVGWARAGRIIDQLERAGIVGPHAGSKPRKVLIQDETELLKKLTDVLKQNE